ncbi:hypothetical protein ACF05L_22510 [Streptomyces bobili]|uniref:hypothetical protein n=1 Tax=Streptomyces bobili TaxID=67280 RepID=UPI0036F57B8D
MGRGRRVSLGRWIADLRRYYAADKPRACWSPLLTRDLVTYLETVALALALRRCDRQAVVVLLHVLDRPRTSWPVMRTPAPDAQAPAPVRDPDWVANRSGKRSPVTSSSGS